MREGVLIDRATATKVDPAQAAFAGATGETWRARPALATAIRLVALGAPVALSVTVVYGVARAVGPPSATRALTLGWWVCLSGVATLSLVVAGRLVRRLLPLEALLRLSLVFPDSAPSRFRMALRTGALETLQERLADARRGAAIRTPVQSARLLLALVADLDEHDPLTRGHSERVRAYAQSIGRELGLDRGDLDLLNWAALLHDVGKLEVPHEILAKPGPPTESEWEALRGHPEVGAQLAAPLHGWLGEWSMAIEQHHERWDGTGYPHGLAGEEISLAGRIVAVADVFDVITSSRSYRRSASVAEARRELLRCAGTQFDPEVVRAFLGISVRQSRLAAPLAWLGQTVVLARLPVTQAASGLSVGAAAVAVGVGAGGGPSLPSPADAQPVRAAVATSAATRAHQPLARKVRTHAPGSTGQRAATPAPARRTRVPPGGGEERPAGPPVPPIRSTPSSSDAPQRGDIRSRPPRRERDSRDPSYPALVDAPVTPPPAPDVVTTTVEDVTEQAAPVADALTTVVEQVAPVVATPPAAPPAPSSPAPTPSSLPPAPPSAQSSPTPSSPTEPPPPSSPDPDGSDGLLDGVLPLLTGLLWPGG